jgi:hypothetical protein
MHKFRDVSRRAAIAAAFVSFGLSGVIKVSAAEVALAADESVPNTANEKKKDDLTEIVVTGSRISRPI